MLRYVRAIKKRLGKLLLRFVPGLTFRARVLKWIGYKVGEQASIGEDLIIVDTMHQKPMVYIGDRVCIGPRVTFVTSSGVPFSKLRPILGSKVQPIVVKDDALVGAGVIVLPGITVGEGAVVGAGAVVTKDVPPFTIVVGVPAKPIKRIDIEKGRIIDLRKQQS